MRDEDVVRLVYTLREEFEVRQGLLHHELLRDVLAKTVRATGQYDQILRLLFVRYGEDRKVTIWDRSTERYDDRSVDFDRGPDSFGDS